MSLNYVMLGSNDVVKSRGFYDAVMPVVGGKLVAEYMPNAYCYELRGGGRIWIAKPYDEGKSTPGNGTMVGLLCESVAEVCKVHETALASGGQNEGDPGPRPMYGPNFFGSYARDLDGNKMSFVFFNYQET